MGMERGNWMKISSLMMILDIKNFWGFCANNLLWYLFPPFNLAACKPCRERPSNNCLWKECSIYVLYCLRVELMNFCTIVNNLRFVSIWAIAIYKIYSMLIIILKDHTILIMWDRNGNVPSSANYADRRLVVFVGVTITVRCDMGECLQFDTGWQCIARVGLICSNTSSTNTSDKVWWKYAISWTLPSSITKESIPSLHSRRNLSIQGLLDDVNAFLCCRIMYKWELDNTGVIENLNHIVIDRTSPGCVIGDKSMITSRDTNIFAGVVASGRPSSFESSFLWLRLPHLLVVDFVK